MQRSSVVAGLTLVLDSLCLGFLLFCFFFLRLKCATKEMEANFHIYKSLSRFVSYLVGSFRPGSGIDLATVGVLTMIYNRAFIC
jgi:hypothetical protein